MNELIKIDCRERAGATVQTVNARELHQFLETKVRFNDWIKKRIADYGFAEGVDYIKVALPAGMKMAKNGGEIGGIASAQNNVALESDGYESFGQQGRIEYALTLDMSKELAMVERNEKGKQARQYFLECEKRAQAVPALPRTFAEALRLAASQAEEMERQQALIVEMAPKADFHDKVTEAINCQTVQEFAKA